jgi:hypothetical protein
MTEERVRAGPETGFLAHKTPAGNKEERAYDRAAISVVLDRRPVEREYREPQ